MMNNQNNPYNQAPRNWKQRTKIGNTSRPLTLQQERTLPNWLIGKSVLFFFIAFIACTIVWGYPMEMRDAINSSFFRAFLRN